jgi:Ser/Thr protein kinase RdoA (MazF antagonist)
MTLGQTLTTPPPRLDPQEAARLLQSHWGLRAELTPLASERDLNFRVEGQPRHVLKLANPAEPPAVTAFQTEALLHLEASGLPVPRVVPSDQGAMVETPHGLLRLLTYLEGQPLAHAPRSDRQRAAIGHLAARLTQALGTFRHPGEDQDLQWDIRHTARLRPLLSHLPADLMGLCTATLEDFEAQALPHLAGLPWQVVHNDLNPHNLLTDPADPDRITGILDFGDMLRTARICDMGVTASYQIDPERPQESLAAFAGAYAAILPLEPAEARLLPLLARARMLTTLVIGHARAARYPENAAYILRNAPAAAAALRSLA